MPRFVFPRAYYILASGRQPTRPPRSTPGLKSLTTPSLRKSLTTVTTEKLRHLKIKCLKHMAYKGCTKPSCARRKRLYVAFVPLSSTCEIHVFKAFDFQKIFDTLYIKQLLFLLNGARTTGGGLERGQKMIDWQAVLQEHV
ncbi:hypothetical protein B0H19DRAFT_1072058 [Mycena capillaripes]|nr:hypothetical protein B0H19DRAFT_1072058 [Mycena capillaripes]